MILAVNKKAFHDYNILEKLEAGLKLQGQEVKSAKQKNISLKGAYVTISYTGHNHQPEAWLLNAHISPYKFAGNLKSYEPTRSRKLLLKKNEVLRLIGLKKQKGLTFIPISVYTKKGLIKLELGICRGKKLFDKRQDIKKRESQRETQRLFRSKS
ncbi:MAG: SsrA-binding protein SmpB [Patescibacteria group bacterium]|jgi:SsrA-binding protein